MLFNSFEFIFCFLPVAVIIYFLLAEFGMFKCATTFLVGASLVFYAYWDSQFLGVLLVSILFNYVFGRLIEKYQTKTLLITGVCFNLALLAYFKYAKFMISNIAWLFQSAITIPSIVLPLGISFFTFTQIAYLVDIYRRETKSYNILVYSLFVTFFPHLIAGPLLYHKQIIPQFINLDNFSFSHRNMARGITFFVMGLFKKIIIADNLAPWVKVLYDNPHNATFVDAWAGTLAYTLQLYFDFSGYCEMAIGLGLMFNICLPINFNSPYKATSVIDFWRRWHITLSSFLKNYLYIPLGGNRGGEWNHLRNLMITMLLGGLWHGAAWTFVVWGALHGFYLVINHMWRKLKIALPKLIAWSMTFGCVTIAWVFFRATTIQDACSIVRAMVGLKGLSGFTRANSVEIMILLGLLAIITLLPNVLEILQYNCSDTDKPNTHVWRYGMAQAMIIGGVFFFLIHKILTAAPSEFLYFQF